MDALNDIFANNKEVIHANNGIFAHMLPFNIPCKYGRDTIDIPKNRHNVGIVMYVTFKSINLVYNLMLH